MLRTVIACTGHRVPPIQAKQIEMQTTKASPTLSVTQDDDKDIKKISLVSKHLHMTNEDITPLSELDEVDLLVQHLQDEPRGNMAATLSHNVTDQESNRNIGSISDHMKQDQHDHQAIHLNRQNKLRSMSAQEMREDWEREVLRSGLSW